MQICCWPLEPVLPPLGESVLIRVSVPGCTRSDARGKARDVLRTVLAGWCNLSLSQILLNETGKGPACSNKLSGTAFDISLAYGAGEAWIGLACGGRIGVDVMRVEPFAEAWAVAQAYLGPSVVAAMAQSQDPERVFAAAWTMREAQLKCARLGLVEWTSVEMAAAIETRLDGPDWMGAVALHPHR